MDIGFIWDKDKYQEVRKKHRVRYYEVVAAFDDPNGYEIQDPAGHIDRWVWTGATAAGRVLTVTYSDEDLPLYRLITAFDTVGSRLDEYYHRKRN